MAGQSGLNALATVLYPVQIRATGTGWSSGIGRVLALTVPFVGGPRVRSDLSFLSISSWIALPVLLTAPVVFMLGLQPRAAAQAEPAAARPVQA